jgi:hypothetical protein
MAVYGQMFWAHTNPHIRGTEEEYLMGRFMLFMKKNLVA